MSHFSVIVIGPDVEHQLAPYHEFECTGVNDEHVKDVDITEEAREDFAKRTDTRLKAPDGTLHDFFDEKGEWRPEFSQPDPNRMSYDQNRRIRFVPDGYEQVEVPASTVESFADFIEGWYGIEPVLVALRNRDPARHVRDHGRRRHVLPRDRVCAGRCEGRCCMNKIGCVGHDCPECETRETFIADVRRFTEAVGCTTDRFNVRQTALYIGLQLEEMAEKLEALGFTDKESRLQIVARLREQSRYFKDGRQDHLVEKADRAAMLDADIDLAWVTVGAALSSGADVLGAMREVAQANLDKLVECEVCNGEGHFHSHPCTECGGYGAVAIKDANGKVQKPEGWKAPDVTPFVCKGEA